MSLTDNHSFRLFTFVFLSLFVGFLLLYRCNDDGPRSRHDLTHRYQPLMNADQLLLTLVLLPPLGLMIVGPGRTAEFALALCFQIFLHIAVYYALLLPLTPLLRRFISARGCAMLWLLPNFLYLCLNSTFLPDAPAFVLRARGNWVWLVLGLWLAGAIAVFAWNTLSHLRFRRQLLEGARPVTDEEVLDIWQEELDRAQRKPLSLPLVISPHTSTPLSVGLFRGSMQVVLPPRTYTPDELHLVFRHEIVHICRRDSWNKFFLMFCTALCWFDPLMWMAMRRSAEDTELSCDETVLVDADDATRRQYAQLLLTTAGDGRGYTTCLSPAAASLRYRLRSVVAPRRRAAGGILVVLVLFLLLSSFGYVALSYDERTGADIFFGGDPAGYTLHAVWRDGKLLDCADPKALADHLSALSLARLTGNYDYRQQDRTTYIFYFDPPRTDMGSLRVLLSGSQCEISHSNSALFRPYYLPEGVDIEQLDSLLTS
ncbi:M56 family metallopeptidase [Colidextribacter sp. 210702-DFI.3.9]|nr:M56 family metallopeptidase [Colidextribacter sp. 210702-DFI.3.9]MCG4469537.1 M56 family metallopeptidase [Lawsonibacter sp. DFI.6.74]MCG4773598.1 M56 family metallopeptidase [Lawsonibacter sp. DFI.5.51]